MVPDLVGRTLLGLFADTLALVIVPDEVGGAFEYLGADALAVVGVLDLGRDTPGVRSAIAHASLGIQNLMGGTFDVLDADAFAEVVIQVWLGGRLNFFADALADVIIPNLGGLAVLDLLTLAAALLEVEDLIVGALNRCHANAPTEVVIPGLVRGHF